VSGVSLSPHDAVDGRMISRLSRARWERGVRCIVGFLMVDEEDDVLVCEAGIVVPGDILWMLETRKCSVEVFADLLPGVLSCEV
jgi:hypothetical protein